MHRRLMEEYAPLLAGGDAAAGAHSSSSSPAVAVPTFGGAHVPSPINVAAANGNLQAPGSSSPADERDGVGQRAVQGLGTSVAGTYFRVLAMLLVCGLWLVSSSSIIIANRIILVEKHFPYPIAVAAGGMLACSIFAFIYCDVLQLTPPTGIDSKFYLTSIVPVGIAQALTLWVSNGLYLYLTVAFIEMARSSMPLYTLLALHVAGLESPTLRIMLSVCLVAIGCAVSAYGEVSLSLIGVLSLTFAFTCEAIRLVMMQYLLVGRKFHPIVGLKLLSPAALAGLLPMSFLIEYPSMIASGALTTVYRDWPVFLLAASLGLATNIMGMFVISLSSATTLKVLGAIRGPLVVTVGMFLFNEVVTALQGFGYVLAMIGFVWYQWAKSQQILEAPTVAAVKGGS